MNKFVQNVWRPKKQTATDLPPLNFILADAQQIGNSQADPACILDSSDRDQGLPIG
ncbi:MAG TPA: hypothetical protein V6D12_09325 [Candidatus Obscuribacterales bacterium]